MLFLVLFLFFAVVGSMVFLVVWQIRKTDPNRLDSSVSMKLDDAQSFLPFQLEDHGVISLGNHQYRAILEVGAINYELRTEKERDVIEMSFEKMMNSLKFPFSFHIQTRRLDSRRFLDDFDERSRAFQEKHVELRDLHDAYRQSYANLHHVLGNNREIRKYIVIPFEEARDLEKLNDEEKRQYSMEQLLTRVHTVRELLANIGLRSSLCSTAKVAQILFTPYHKDQPESVEHIMSGEYLTTLVDAVSKTEHASYEQRLDFVLHEAQMQILSNLRPNARFAQEAKALDEVVEALAVLRKQVGGVHDTITEQPVTTEQFQYWTTKREEA